MPSRRLASYVWLAVLAWGCASTAAHGDDWLQFRKNPGRTGASQDVTEFPLTDVWIWNTRGVKDSTPTYEAVVQGERIWFLAREGKYRNLVCANSKTGTPLWRFQLEAPELLVRGVPAVSGNGIVYVYDAVPGLLPDTSYNRLERSGGNLHLITRDLSKIGGFVIRAIQAQTGRQLDVLPLESLQMMGDVPQVVLLDGLNNLKHALLRPSNRPTLDVGSLGPPLLMRDELIACTQMDLFLRWAPRRLLTATSIKHHFNEFPNEFWGFPPVATTGGILVADDQTPTRFALAIGGDNFHSWHLDLQYPMGVPAAESDLVCFGLGGLSARDGVMCLNAASGEVQWVYAPTGLDGPGARPGRQKVSKYFSVPLPRQRGARTRRRPPPPRGGGSEPGTRPFDENSFTIIRKAGWHYANRSDPSLPPGHESNGGIVITEKGVYAQACGAIVALDRSKGLLLWRQPIPPAAFVQSLVASSKHLIACYTIPTGGIRGRAAPRGREDQREGRTRTWEHIPTWDSAVRKTAGRHFVVAYRLDNGQQVWKDELLQPGTFSLAEGLVYFANGDLTAYGPAERTYLVAADSDDPKHYVRPAQPRDRDAEARQATAMEAVAMEAEKSPTPAGGEPAPGAGEEAARQPSVALPEVRADSSLLRLTYGAPGDTLVQQVRDRVKLLKDKGVSLSLELDWLDEKRTRVMGAAGIHWTDAAASDFVALCQRLAEEAGPLFFDIAPEVNVYLRRYPEQLRTVLGVLQDARLAIRQAAPRCRVIVSLNVEVLMDAYGKGLVWPFGELPKAAPQPREAVKAMLLEFAQVVELVDAVGLTLRPQAGFRNTGVLPPDYLLRLRTYIPRKPLLVTRIIVEADAPGRIARAEQADYARRMLQCCYWLNAQLVVQPKLIGYPETAVGENGGRTDPIRLIAEKWQRVVSWELVTKLTAKPPLASGLTAATSEGVEPSVP